MSSPTFDLISACDRTEDFRAIHEPGVTLESVLCLQEAVGIDEETRVLIRERLDQVGTRDRGATLLGLIIGLLATQLDGGLVEPP